MWQELYPDVFLSIEEITPDMAKGWLKTMKTNRKPRLKHIQGLKESILRGEWRLNGQAFVFNKKGEMIDGQHRSLATIEANTPIVSIVARGIDDDAKVTIDIGESRSVRDHLVIQGTNVSGALLSAIHTIYKLAQIKIGDPKDWMINYKMSRVRALPVHAAAICNRYPQIHEMLLKVKTHPSTLRGNMVGVALLYGLHDEENASQWLNIVNEHVPPAIDDLFSQTADMHNLKRIAHLVNNINSAFDVEPIDVMWEQRMPPMPAEVIALI
jgi:hypothetical protein